MRVRLPSRSFGCLFESLTPRRNRDPSGTFDVLAQLGRGAGSRCRMLRVRIPRTSLLGLVAQRKRPPTQTRRGVGSSPTQVIPARARIYWRHLASSPNWQGRRLMSAVVQVRILSKPLARPSRGCGAVRTSLRCFMPVHDWQFWVVSAIALGALVFLLRRVLPAGMWGKKKPGTKTSLTIGGKAVGDKKK